MQHSTRKMDNQWLKRQFSSLSQSTSRPKWHLKRTKRKPWQRSRSTPRKWRLLTIPREKTVKVQSWRRNSKSKADRSRIKVLKRLIMSDRRTFLCPITNNRPRKDQEKMWLWPSKSSSHTPKTMLWIEPSRKIVWMIPWYQTKSQDHLSSLTSRILWNQVLSSTKFSTRGQ